MNMKAILGGGIFVALGLYLLKQTLENMKAYSTSRNWPKVVGKILSVEIGKFKNSHSLFVSYEYIVNDKRMSSNKIALWTLGSHYAQEYAKVFKKDQECDVYYDPKKPKRAVLIVGPPAHGKKYSDLILSILAIVVGSGVMIYAALAT